MSQPRQYIVNVCKFLLQIYKYLQIHMIKQTFPGFKKCLIIIYFR